MQDNEYINVMQGGVKDWWQSPVDRTFNPYKNDEGYEQYRHLWKDVRNESHFEFLKSKIDQNLSRKKRLALTSRNFGPSLVAGLTDPINLVAIPFTGGIGFLANVSKAGLKVGGLVGATEFIRRPLDPTSTNEETAYYVGGAFLLGGALNATIGSSLSSLRSQSVKINKNKNLDDVSIPEHASEKIHFADTAEEGMPVFDAEVDNNLIFNPKDYEPHIFLEEKLIKEQPNAVASPDTIFYSKINRIMNDVYQKNKSNNFLEKDLKFKVDTKGMKKDGTLINPRPKTYRSPNKMETELDILAKILQTKKGQNDLIKSLKEADLEKEFSRFLSEESGIKKTYMGVSWEKAKNRGMPWNDFKELKKRLSDHKMIITSLRKTSKSYRDALKELENPDIFKKLQTKEDMQSLNVTEARYMDNIIESMKENPQQNFRSLLLGKVSKQEDIEPLIKRFKVLITENEKKIDTYSIGGKFTKKLEFLGSKGLIHDLDLLNELKRIDYRPVKDLIKLRFDGNSTGIQSFKRYIKHKVSTGKSAEITSKNTPSKLIKYDPESGLMMRDTIGLKKAYKEKLYTKKINDIEPIPSFKTFADYLDFRVLKEIYRETRFLKKEIKVFTPVNYVSKSKVRKDGGDEVNAWFDGKSININKKALLDSFKNSPWTKPKVEGVKPLAKDQFKTPEEWYNFVLRHEQMHTFHKRLPEETKGAYENRINALALNKDNVLVKTDAQYENLLNQKTLKELNIKKSVDYTEDIPFWAREISSFQSDYGFIANIKDKLPNIKTAPLIGSMMARLSGDHSIPNRLARYGITQPPSVLAELNTRYMIKYKELIDALDNAHVRVNTNNTDPSIFLGVNISSATIRAKEVFAKNKIKEQLKNNKETDKPIMVTHEQVMEAVSRGVISKEYRKRLPDEMMEAINAFIDFTKFHKKVFQDHKTFVSSGGFEKVMLLKKKRSAEIGNIIKANNSKTKNKLSKEQIDALYAKQNELDEQALKYQTSHKLSLEDEKLLRDAGMVKNYEEDFFYRVWDVDKVMADTEGLKKKLLAHYTKNELILKPYTKIIDGQEVKLKEVIPLADMQGYRGITFDKPRVVGQKRERAFTSIKDKMFKGLDDQEFKVAYNKYFNSLKDKGLNPRPKTVQSGARQIEDRVNGEIDQIMTQSAHGDSTNIGGLGIDNFGKYVSGSTTFMSRGVDVPNELIMEYLQLNAKSIASNYKQKVSPASAIIEQFGDHHLDDALSVLEIELITKDLGKNVSKKDIDNIINSFVDTKDKMLGQFNLEDPTSLNKKISTFLRDWASLAYMGKVVVSALPDIGKLVMSQGFQKTFGKGFVGLFENLHMMKHAQGNVQKMGIASDYYMGMMKRRFIEDSGSTAWAGSTSAFGKAFDKVGQKMNDAQGPWYVLNGLTIYTAAMKLQAGVLQADDLLRLSFKSAEGTATPKDILRLLQAGIDKDTAKIISKMPVEKVGANDDVVSKVVTRDLGDDNVLFTANVDSWTGPGSQNARMRFRQAVYTDTNRTIVTPNVSDTPGLMSGGQRIRSKGMQNALSGKVGGMLGYMPDARGGKISNAALSLPFQFFSWGMGANRKIVLSGLSGREAYYMQGVVAMLALGGYSDYLKNPNYWHYKSTEEKIIRAIEVSGIGGMLTDMNFMLETLSQGFLDYPLGLRPAIGIDPRFGEATTVDALGEVVGAGPSIPLDILNYIMDDDATTEEGLNLFRRQIPGNSLVWTDGLFKSIYNTTTDVFK